MKVSHSVLIHTLNQRFCRVLHKYILFLRQIFTNHTELIHQVWRKMLLSVIICDPDVLDVLVMFCALVDVEVSVVLDFEFWGVD